MTTSSSFTTSSDPAAAGVSTNLPGEGSDGGESTRFVERVVQGAHDAVDRAAERAVPAVERLRSGISSAGESLNQRAERLGQVQEQWLQSCRSTVREHPIGAVAAGVLVGWLLARMSSR